MTIFHRARLGSNFGFTYDVDWDTLEKLERAKIRYSDKKIKELLSGVEEQEEVCSLADVKEIIEKSDNKYICNHFEANDFLEELRVAIDGTEFRLSISLFPKNKRDAGISMSVMQEKLRATLGSRSKPESIVAFMEEISSWMPEYNMIEEKWKEEQKKKELASDIAFDLLKRVAEEKLESKGYTFTIENTHYQYRARIRISLPKGVEITFVICLLDDFYDEISRIVDSLPSRI